MKELLGTVFFGMIMDENESAYFVQQQGVTFRLDKTEGDFKIGEAVEGFAYVNQRDEKRFTTQIPKSYVGHYAYGTVVASRKDLGVFVDIGLPDKEMALSLDELPTMKELWPKKGDQLMVSLRVDDKERMWATLASEQIFHALSRQGNESMHNQNIEGIVFRLKLIGTYILTEDYYIGFIHPSEREREPRLGEKVTGRVIGVRADGVLNLSLKPRSYEVISDDAQMILTFLEHDKDKRIPYTDKSSPDAIKAMFAISKGQFKRALGSLMKQGRIIQKDGYTYLVETDEAGNSQVRDSKLRFQLNLFQLFYWMAFCGISGFATVYLLSQQITDIQIGLIVASGSLLSVCMQVLTGVFIDKFPALTVKKVILIFLGVTGIMMFGVLLVGNNPLFVSILYCLGLVFLLNLQPLVTALIYEYINNGANVSFSVSRGIGSMAYGLFSFGMGIWLESHSKVYIPLLSGLFMVILVGILAWLPKIKEEEDVLINQAVDGESSGSMFRQYPGLLSFILGIVSLFTFHTIVNVFLPQIIEHVQGGSRELGFVIALAAFCEIPIMFFFERLERRFGVRHLLQVSAIFFVLKAVIYATVPSFSVILTSQVLQSLSFALITPAYASYTNQWMKPTDRVKGQTFMMAAVTLGNVVGSLLGGQVLDRASVESLLVIGLGMTLLGMILMFISLRYSKKAISES